MRSFMGSFQQLVPVKPRCPKLSSGRFGPAVESGVADSSVETTSATQTQEATYSQATVTTETGTIAADVPTGDVRYEMVWTESRPRVLSDFELGKVKEASNAKARNVLAWDPRSNEEAIVASGESLIALRSA